MYNMEYYGFSLLCRVQQECNSHFRDAPEFFELSSLQVAEIFNSCTRGYSSRSVRPPKGYAFDFSGLSSGKGCIELVREFDLVGRFCGGVLSSEVVNCIADACQSAGLESKLYRLSQWTPDRKRSTLMLVDTAATSPEAEVLAFSLGNVESLRAYAFGGVGGVNKLRKLQRSSGVKHILSDYEIEISTKQCSRMCETFMDLARERRLLQI